MHDEDKDLEFTAQRSLKNLRVVLWSVIIFMAAIGALLVGFRNRYDDFLSIFQYIFSSFIAFFVIGSVFVLLALPVVDHIMSKRSQKVHKELSFGFIVFFAIIILAAVSAIFALFFLVLR